MILFVLYVTAGLMANQTGDKGKPSAAAIIERMIQDSGIESANHKFREIKSKKDGIQFIEREFNMLGYRLIQHGKISEAVEVFKMNIELFPNSPNVYDSLGECYLFLGDKKKALESFGKIKSIDPNHSASERIIKNIEIEHVIRQNQKHLFFLGCSKRGDLNSVRSWAEGYPRLINKKSRDGNTVLHLAVYGGHMDVVDYLVRHGANLNIRNVSGQTPYNLAEINGIEGIKQILIANGGEKNPQRFPQLTGKYLGQKEPGRVPALFAQGIVSTHSGVYGNIVFSPDFSEVCWTRNEKAGPSHHGGFMMMKSLKGEWSEVKEVKFVSSDQRQRNPFYSWDGKRLYFQASSKKNEGMDQHEKFYFVERDKNGYSEPKILDPALNEYSVHWQFSLDRKNNLYFGGKKRDSEGKGGICFSKYEKGRYLKPVSLPASINSGGISISPFISPDGEYLIFTRFVPPEVSLPRFILFISFSNVKDEWSDPIDLSETLQLNGHINNARVTPDGKYLFFVYQDAAYWVSMKNILKLNPYLKLANI